MDENRETLRAFFGIDLGEAARRVARDRSLALRQQPGANDARWVRPEDFHVTLRFLGDIEREIVPDLIAAVRESVAGIGPFELYLGEVIGFPSPRRPRVVALELAPEELLAELARAVEAGVCAAGLDPEERHFRPHLTLARIRRGRPARHMVLGEGSRADRAAPAPGEPRPTGRFDVTEALLYRSHLSPRGQAARYEVLERIALVG